MIVIGIMGLLSMVVASGYTHARERALDQKLRAHLMAVRAANIQAQQDTGCTFPVVPYLSLATTPPSGWTTTSGTYGGCTIPPGSWRGPYITGLENWAASVPGFTYTYAYPPYSKSDIIYIAQSTVSTDGTTYDTW